MTTKTDRYSLYEERGDLLERKAISEKFGTGWYLQAQLEEINEQIRVIENVTLQAQKYYFEDVASASTPDPRIARRESILAAFRDEPLSKAKAAELYAELAEIDSSLQIHPSDTCNVYIGAAWDKNLEEVQF